MQFDSAMGLLSMDKKLKKKWVAALRSGEYKKGVGQLCRISPSGAEYCCLGVLYEVANSESAWRVSPRDPQTLTTKSGEEMSYGGRWFSRVTLHELQDMNDFGRSFETIAKWIEENAKEN